MTEKPPGQDPVGPDADPHGRESIARDDSASDNRDFPWWRWFAAVWAGLALAGLALRDWGTLGMALAFTAGFGVQELRSHQRRESKSSAQLLVFLSAATAALGSAGVYLMLRFRFGWPAPWWVTLLLFIVLLVVYLAGPALLHLARTRSSCHPRGA